MTEIVDMQESFHYLREVVAPRDLAPTVLTRVGLADRYFRFDDTPIGSVFVAYNDRGVSAVMRQDSAAAFELAAGDYLGRPVYPTEPPERLVRDIADHLRGGRRAVRFDLRGLSEFEQAVLRKALAIPRGQIRPYAWVAREIGNPRAVRAVGSALAGNPIPLLIPCHRVVKSSGELGNYGLGGPETKRALLAWEGADVDEVEALARAGIRFIGSSRTGTFCVPTCTPPPGIDPRYRRHFHSAAEAIAAGYQPCEECRPVAAS